jgi:hypothetical protein
MKLRARILRLLTPEYGGERPLSVLEGIAGSKDALWTTLRPMLDQREVVRRRCNGGMRIALARQRGFTWLGFVIVCGSATAVIVASWSAVAWHARVNFERGETATQEKWDLEKIERARKEIDRGVAVGHALLLADKARAAADTKAADMQDKWKEALREARRNGESLGSCPEPRPVESPRATTAAVAGEPAGAGVRAPGLPADRAGVRLHWRFVGLYDSAFLGLDGKPVFGDSAQFALDASRANTPSPYGLDELLEVHGENARALGACLRAYGDAMTKIDDAAAAWEKSR